MITAEDNGADLPTPWFGAEQAHVQYAIGLHDKIRSGSLFRLKCSSPLSQENNDGNNARGLYYENEIQTHYSQNIEFRYSQHTQDMMDDDEASKFHHTDQLQAFKKKTAGYHFSDKHCIYLNLQEVND